MLCILPYSCFFFPEYIVDSTISPIKKELDPHVGSDCDLKEDCKVVCCCCYCSQVQVAGAFLTFHQLFHLHLKSNKSAVLKQ